MSKDHNEAEDSCQSVAQKLTDLINMPFINFLTSYSTNLNGKELLHKKIRTELVNLKKSLDYTENFFNGLLRQNKKSEAQYLLLALEKNLQHFLNYYLSKSALYDYIHENWNGEWRHLIFQTSSTGRMYLDKKNKLNIDKKNYSNDSHDFLYDCLANCFTGAWDVLLEMKASYEHSVLGKQRAGRKKIRPLMEEIYFKEFMDQDLENLKNKGYITFDESTCKWKWQKKKKEFAKFFWRAQKKKRFNPDYDLRSCGAAFLYFFGMPEKKSNLQYFEQNYYDANLSGDDYFPL